MATGDKKFLRWDPTNGKIKEVNATQTGGSTTYADQIPALDGNGKLAASMLPSTVLSVQTINTSEAVSNGDFVNVYFDTTAAALKVRKASNASGSGFKEAHGYVTVGVAINTDATVYMLGTGNNGLSGLSPGKPYFLASAGAVQEGTSTNLAAIQAANQWAQYLGIAVNATTISTVVSPPVQTAA